ncbi:Regulatory protein, LysR:LysR, substrate-binding [Serinicoccus hydrothermalis]|uniref:Regulatory protein, LysR:LysR, substrate-binding n=1 Tax=Serinicoccus hydrothermalis TaxID=1758689 RepID=A0A1B1ND80_9MICO|nr:LysR family transcriptional regulator [Serinicoccus hydrothermalis]ANS79410.1 Regulatory protein, LysR:LysR, substrate-binding [Serinicoccus hydrothermalis]
MIDRRLQVLRMVAQRGKVTAAAEALSYTPSAVSQQLRALGRELGVELLVQDGRGVRLSPAAQVLLDRTDDLVCRWEEIRAEVARVARTGGGVLRLAGFSTAASALLPGVAARVRAEVGSEVQIVEADPEECFELLLTGRADVAVVVALSGLPASTDPRFEQRALLEDPIDLLVHDGHPLAGREWVSLRDLAGERWIMDRPGRPYHELLQTACTGAGFTPSVAHYAAEWDTGAALVGADLGIALIPRLAQIPAAYPVVRVPLHGDPAPARHLRTGIRRGSGEHPGVATALAALQEAAAGR